MNERPSKVDTADQRAPVRLTSEQIWQELAKGSFAVVSYSTPAGEPRLDGQRTLGDLVILWAG
jgi:hypothetical protein